MEPSGDNAIPSAENSTPRPSGRCKGMPSDVIFLQRQIIMKENYLSPKMSVLLHSVINLCRFMSM